MFRANDQHNQQSVFGSANWMDPRVRDKLNRSWAPIFYEHVFSRIDEQPFSVLYGTTGTPNFPVNILLSLEYIKHIRDCSDQELLEAFLFDFQVNFAVGIHTLGEMNLAERTLYYFRERVYNYCLQNPDKEDLMFGQFVKLLRDFADKAGVTLDKQRTDTTLFMSNIKKAGRMALAYDVLVTAGKALPVDMRPDFLAWALEPSFKTDMLYRTKAQDKDSKLTTLLNLCVGALELLKQQPDKDEEAKLVERFLNEPSVADEETGKRKPKPNKEISSSSLQSAYDPDATFRRKGDVSQSGYVLELSETCGKENPFQLITDYKVEPNNVSDQEILLGRLGTISENTGCSDMYVDGGFQSEDVHETAAENGIDIHMTNMSGTEPKNLPASAFDIDEETNVINRCPGGHVPTNAGVSKSQTTAHFPHEACANCEFSAQCQSKPLVKDCVVRINIKSVVADRERETMKADRVENTSYRAGIEGSNSALKRKGLDKLDIRGKTKSEIVCGLKTTAQNIKRFTKYLRGGYKQKQEKPPHSGILAPSFA